MKEIILAPEDINSHVNSDKLINSGNFEIKQIDYKQSKNLLGIKSKYEEDVY